MSGYFDYIQNNFDELNTELRKLIQSDQYGINTITEFHNALSLSQELEVLINRIDYLVGNEETEESFHQSLAEDLGDLEDTDLFELDFN